MTLLSFWSPPTTRAALYSEYLPPGWSVNGTLANSSTQFRPPRYPGQSTGSWTIGTDNGRVHYSEPFGRIDQSDVLTVGFALYMHTAGTLSGGKSYLVYLGGPTHADGARLAMAPDGRLQLPGHLGPVAMLPLAIDCWHYIEWAYKAPVYGVSPISVVNKLVVNGEVVSDTELWGWDGNNGSRKGMSQASFRPQTYGVGSTQTTGAYMTDLYVAAGPTAEFLGDVTVDRLHLTGSGSVSEFVGSDGNSVDNYLNVDQSVVDPLSFNTSGVDGARDAYTLGGYAPHGASELRALMPLGMASKNGDLVTTLTPTIRQGVHTSVGATTYLANGAGGPLKATPFTTSPSGAPWTLADLNASELEWQLNYE